MFAIVPLLIATGPGRHGFSMGLVIAAGMTIGTAFTLFVLPAFYLYMARDHHAEQAKQAAIAAVANRSTADSTHHQSKRAPQGARFAGLTSSAAHVGRPH